MLQLMLQRPALLFFQGIGLQLRSYPQPLTHHRDHTVGQQRCQHIFHVPVALLPQLPQKPLLQLLLCKRGLQVDGKPIGMLVPIPQMRTGR